MLVTLLIVTVVILPNHFATFLKHVPEENNLNLNEIYVLLLVIAENKFIT